MINVPHIQTALFTRYHDRYEMMNANAFLGRYECDFLGIRRSGFIDEFEIKLTRSDFRADFCKSCEDVLKHDELLNGKLPPNYFYFVAPEGIIKLEELNPKYGLIEVTDKGVLKTRKEARRLHKDKASDEQKISLLKKHHWKWWNAFIDKQK